MTVTTYRDSYNSIHIEGTMPDWSLSQDSTISHYAAMLEKPDEWRFAY